MPVTSPRACGLALLAACVIACAPTSETSPENAIDVGAADAASDAAALDGGAGLDGAEVDAGAAVSGANVENLHYFGQHMHRLVAADGAAGTTVFPAPVGARPVVGAIRTWDSGTGSWAIVQPTRDAAPDFSRLDRFVDAARAHGADVLHTLNPGTPAWASARPTEPFVYGAGGAAEPASDADYEAHLRALFTHFRGRIQLYELWNEPTFVGPGGGGFYTGTPERLFALQQLTYRVLHEVDPGARLLGPGFVNVSGDGGAVAQYLRVTGSAYSASADAFAFHYYVARPEETLEVHRRLREILALYGLEHMPILNTEAGWPTTDVHPEIAGAIDPARLPGWMARAYLLGRYAGLERYFYYSYDGYATDFSVPATGELRPAGAALRQLGRWLIGATLGECFYLGSSVYACDVTRQTAGRGHIVWSADDGAPVALDFPSEWGALAIAEHLDGSIESLDARTSMQVTGEPTLVRATSLPWDYDPADPVALAPPAFWGCADDHDYVAAVRADAPTAWYRLSAGAALMDASGHGLDATWLGARAASVPGALVAGDDGALDFTAADDSIAMLVPGTVDPWAGDFTIELWANVADRSRASMALVQEQYGVRGFRFAPTSSRSTQFGPWELWTTESGGDASLPSTVSWPTHEWHHFAIERELATRRLSLFVDGRLDRSVVADLVPPGGGLRLGSGGGYPYAGALDEVAIYDRVLSADRVLAHARVGGGLCGPPVLPR